MSNLLGDCRLVPCKVQHLHPRTGLPPDYHFRTPDGEYHPRWRKQKPLLQPSEMLYSTSEAAKVLGVSVWTVRTMVKKGSIRSTRVGGQIRIKGSWLKDAALPL